MTAIALWARLARATGPRATDVLSAIAFAFATAALLAVLGGVNAFQVRVAEGRVDRFDGELIVTLALVAAALLLRRRLPECRLPARRLPGRRRSRRHPLWPAVPSASSMTRLRDEARGMARTATMASSTVWWVSATRDRK